jgi:hypothetical protein
MVAERSRQKEAAPSFETAGEQSVQGPQEAKASSASDRMRRIVLENLGIVEEKARGILLPMRVSWWRTALSTLWLQNYQTIQIIKETGFVRLEIRLNPKGRFSKDLSERSRFNRSRKISFTQGSIALVLCSLHWKMMSARRWWSPAPSSLTPPLQSCSSYERWCRWLFEHIQRLCIRTESR